MERVNLETVRVTPQLSLLMASEKTAGQQMKNNYCKGNPGVLLVLHLIGSPSLEGQCSGVALHRDGARREGCPVVGSHSTIRQKVV